MIRPLLAVLTALLISTGIFAQGLTERSLRAVETLQTDDVFRYQNVDIPVLDVSYHEFSSDSITWRKDYQAGDCYVRFTNETDNSTDSHPADSWWVLNICDCTGGGGGSDSIIICSGGVCDTIIGTAVINIPVPDTITGSTGNVQTDSYHTHAIKLFMEDLKNVDTTSIKDQSVLKWNSVDSKWVMGKDLMGSSGSSLTVQDIDGNPTVEGVSTIRIENGHLADNGSGTVTLSLEVSSAGGEQDFYRADTVAVTAGDTFLTFSRPLPENDYIVVNAYALYSNGERQNLSYDTKTTDGFRVLNVIGNSLVHYQVIRNLDSLFLAVDNQGRILASASDTVLGYLDSKTDGVSIGVIDNKLSFIGDTINVTQVTTDDLIINNDTLSGTTQASATDTTIATYEWVLSVAGSGNGWDSLTYDDGYISWWYGGLKLDSTSTGYVELSDSGVVFITPSQLEDALNDAEGLKQMTYTITLPVSQSLTNVLSAAIESEDYPTGWTLDDDNGSLLIEHNLGRYATSVTVFYNTSGDAYRQLGNFNNAYSGVLNEDEDNLIIEGLSETYKSYKQKIFITFE